MPSVLIIDDNLLVRQGLKHLLSEEYRGLVFGEAKTSEEAAARLASRTWDVVVIEVSIPGLNGFQMVQEIRRSYPATRVLMLSPHTNPQYALRARQLRASGYAGQNATRAELLRAFHAVLAGKEHFVHPHRGGPGTNPMPMSTPMHTGLSARERDILLACVAGKRVGEIATELNLSIKTVSTYKRRVLNKLQLNSVSDLVRYAINHKLT
jgi:DNA-binding NarL/FixJ family response regulator